jgi:hypothetical protein
LPASVSGSPLSGRLQRFADGEGIVYATRGWVHVRVPMWRQLDCETQQVLTTRESADGRQRAMIARRHRRDGTVADASGPSVVPH